MAAKPKTGPPREGEQEAWYEAYGSGDEAEPRDVRVEMQEDEEEEEDEEDYEVEEMADDEPMHISGRLYLGSIDAARNVSALRRARIGGILSLLGRGEDQDAVSSIRHDQPGPEITRVTIEMEDSADGNLLCRLPEILATLQELIDKAAWSDKNVLVHCIAGRSRSPSILAGWMIIGGTQHESVQDAVDLIRIIRPWIEINPHFMRDLHLFHATLAAAHDAPLDSEHVSVLANRSFPRLDFSAGLVDGILQGTKTTTMRLLSDVEDDANSDLGNIFPHSLVSATSAVRGSNAEQNGEVRRRFAFLRIELCETQKLRELDAATLQKSGFEFVEDMLSVLQQFYPHVTVATPLLMLHFQCVSAN